ncbi:MAG: hypothetical protein H6735_00950 [Alphaproteobacteria bacterium]|nr:hypothetical protein [Alphaproteobacteria bacterium]
MTTPEQAFASRVEAATALSDERRWEEAGRAWIEAARVAVDGRALPSARQVLGLAGEAFRRDDRVDEAAKALRMALSYGPDPVEAVGLQVRLAGLCAELGRGDEGIDRCERARDAASGPMLAMVLDTLAGLLLAYRSKAEARSVVEALSAIPGDAEVAAAFRRAQLLRMDGDLGGARAEARRVVQLLTGRPNAESGLAAARTELAELDLLEGRPLVALGACEEARREHEEAGRRGLALRAEAARVRAAVEGGLEVFPGPLQQGARFAEERGLHVLQLDLRLAAGAAMSRRDPDGARLALQSVVRQAEALGSRLHAGRARLQLLPLLDGEERVRVREQARIDLADHLPLLARVEAT